MSKISIDTLVGRHVKIISNQLDSIYDDLRVLKETDEAMQDDDVLDQIDDLLDEINNTIDVFESWTETQLR